MAYQIPPQDNRSFVQDNTTDTGGNLWSSFNIDLTETQGKLQTTRTKLVTSSDDDADLERVFAFAHHSGDHWAASEYVFRGDDLGSDAFDSKQTGIDNPENLADNGDMLVFNDNLTIIDGDDLYWFDGSDWEEENYGSLNTTGAKILESFGDRLYVSEDDKVYSFDNSATPVLSTSGSNTLDLGLGDNYAITMLESSGDFLWIGVQSLEGSSGFIYQWDGANENTPSNKFKLDSAGVMAGIVRTNENTPTIIDVEGKIMKFNGAGFEEVTQLPLERNIMNSTLDDDNSRAIHPNGMIEFEGKILMLINTELIDETLTKRCPAGVWEYSENNGLYHKYSLSYSAVGDTGTTNISDYGQVKIGTPGALFATIPARGSNSDQPKLLIGSGYHKDGSSTESFGIWVNDEARATQELGYIVTPQLFAGGIHDAWQELYVRYKDFVNGDDKIIVKTRTRDIEPIKADINWIDTKTFTTTDDISAVQEGWEVEIVQGKGGAYSRHVKEINASSSTYEVVLDEEIDVATGSAKARLTNWEKQGEITSGLEEQWQSMPIDDDDVWLQVKLVFIGTGDNEFYDMTVLNSEGVSL